MIFMVIMMAETMCATAKSEGSKLAEIGIVDCVMYISSLNLII